MNRRKGAGYFVEGIVSIIVLLIFVAGSYSTMERNYDWLGFEQETAATDLTYTLKKTGHLDSFVSRGETGAIRGIASSLLNGRMSVSGTVDGLPTGDYVVGVYSDMDGTDRVTDSSLQVATDDQNNDRCINDLDEIEPDQGRIMRTSASGTIESSHGIRLYFADADPGRSGTEELDYDSLWVDNKTECQFTRDEGPYRLNDFISLDGTIYNFYSIDSSGSDTNTTTLQLSEISYELNKDFKQLESATVQVRRFNFSNDLSEFDLLVFKDRENLGDINSRENQFLSYLETGKAVFAMSLQESDLSSGFMSKTGFRWMSLPQNSVSGDEMFGTGEKGQEVRSYFRQLGFRTGEVSVEPDGKIASGKQRYTRKTQILSTSSYIYDRSPWNTINESMISDSDQPAGIPDSDCTDPYRNGSFRFPKGTEDSEKLYAFSIKLSGDGCSSFEYGVALDKKGDGSKNPDGDMDDAGEGVILNNGIIKVNKRVYQVNILAHDEVEFNYIGDNRAELFSYVNDLETQSSGGFGRFPSISGSSSQAKNALLSSLIFMMLEDENRFGSSQGSSITTSASGKTAEGDVYSINLRWMN